MPVLVTPPAILADLTRRGFTLRAVAGQLSITPASALTDNDRATLRTRKHELLAILSSVEPWNQEVALRLLDDADSLVERLGVDGRHPAITDAAKMVGSAYATKDLETVRFAVGEFTFLIRRLTIEQRTTGGARPPS